MESNTIVTRLVAPATTENARPLTKKLPENAGVSSSQKALLKDTLEPRRPRVVIVGGGFGGLAAAKGLAHTNVDVTVVDRENHNVFQPLLYQVASGSLSPDDITTPLRSELRRQKNTSVVMGEVTNVDIARRTIQLKDGPNLPYDYLVLAVGTQPGYFGHPEWAKSTFRLKTIDDAIAIRNHVLSAFEEAQRTADPVRRQELLTFVIVGGGPAGVEMAGAFSELAKHVLKDNATGIKPADVHIILLEGDARVLRTFDPRLSANAQKKLEEFDVDVRASTQVTDIQPGLVKTSSGDIKAQTVLWTAGAKGASLAAKLPVTRDAAGRIEVRGDCSVPGHPEVFAIGDISNHKGVDGKPIPGLGQAATQEGKFVAGMISADLLKKPREDFQYENKGTMAIIGRSAAVAQIGNLKMSGFFAWLTFAGVHILKLPSLRDRVSVFFNWAHSFVTKNSGSRLITRSDRTAIGDADLETANTLAAMATKPGIDLHEMMKKIDLAVANEAGRRERDEARKRPTTLLLSGELPVAANGS